MNENDKLVWRSILRGLEEYSPNEDGELFDLIIQNEDLMGFLSRIDASSLDECYDVDINEFGKMGKRLLEVIKCNEEVAFASGMVHGARLIISLITGE